MTADAMSTVRRALLLAGVLAGTLAAARAADGVPPFAQLKASYLPSDVLVVDRDGQPLQRVRRNATVRRERWVALADVSPALRHAMLVSEDRHFYEHSGVDWTAVGAAAWANLWNTRTRGASTVTMQLAGLLDERLAVPKGGRTLDAKLGQAQVAWQLERRWSKDQILEAYLNLVSFRGETVGIGALSSTVFGKLPSGLDAEEAAIAAALVRSPNAKADAVAKRACGVLHAQKRPVDCALLAGTTRQLLLRRAADPVDTTAQLAPHLARRVVAASTAEAAELRTTLDAGLQRFARDALNQHLTELRDRHVEDGAVIVLDNVSGDVLAWVGSSGRLSQAAQVDNVLALRQAGSTLKPFLYEQAIEERWLTAASVLDDSPVGLSTQAGLYIPQNYDHRFVGPVSVRTALGSSLNVPAVRTLVLVTPERFGSRLSALGLPLKHGGGFYGYSLALGSAEVTLATLANAYRTLANGGLASPLRTRPDDMPGPPRRVLQEAASFVVADMLADREARVPTFGLDNALAARYAVAVKTGTSKDMRDNWCVGFTSRHTVAVWVGNASGDAMHDVSGVTGAAPVWRAVMDELHRQALRMDELHRLALQRDELHRAAAPRDRLPPRDPADAARSPSLTEAPPGVVLAPVRFEPAIEPPRDEWFLAGTEQSVVGLASAAGAARGRIASPADGLLLALDPDIPPDAQQLPLVAAPGTPPTWQWRLDGRPLGAATPRRWPMQPGLHRVELLDARGTVVEASRFEVRGAQWKNGRADG